MRRRIKKARIRFISLVPRGANNLPVLYKSEDGSVTFQTILKTEDLDDKGELTSIVYLQEQYDKHGDIAHPEVVKDAAHAFMRDGEGVDILHDGDPLPKEQAWVAESFIVQKGDPRFVGMKDLDGKTINEEGAWATVIRLEDENLRKKFRTGEWNGVSMAGPAIVEEEKALDEEAVRKVIEQHFGIPKEEPDMKKEEIEELVKTASKTLTEGIVTGVVEGVQKSLDDTLQKALAPEETPPDKRRDPTPEPESSKFEGDPNDPEAVRKYHEELVAKKRQEGVDWNDPVSVKKYLDALDEPEEGEEENELEKENRLLREELSKRGRASKQTSRSRSSREQDTALSKAEFDMWEDGMEIGKIANEMRGYGNGD